MEAIVKINPFTVEQTIFLSDKESFTGFRQTNVNLSELANFLISLDNLTDIHFFGQKDYLEKFIIPVKTKYSNINIYINK